MEKSTSANWVKLLIIFNAVSIFAIVVLFELLKFAENRIWLAGLEILLVIAVLVTFYKAYWQTGLWSLSHKKTEKLDEREMQLISDSLKVSYSVFTIVTLLIIYAVAVIEKGPIDVVIAAGLLYFAHILPSAILGWRGEMKGHNE
ncbi:MAG: hypothetical protein U9N53_13765 [Bacteroidota bacterium]|nr:hypothetical protein [Bacteroidota bacterium]